MTITDLRLLNYCITVLHFMSRLRFVISAIKMIMMSIFY